MLYLSLCLAIVLIVPSCAQSVAQQCLTQQVRITNPNNIPNQQTSSPEVITMAAFDSICRNYQGYVNCFQTGLATSNNPADRFLRLLFSRPDMERAYRGLCTQDLETLRPNIRCLLITPPVRTCYNTFNQAVNQVVNMENQNSLPRVTLQDLACNVSVTRYRCETEEYARCNPRVGQIMQDFFFADIPQQCRISTGARSRFVNVVAASAGCPQWRSMIVRLLVTTVFIALTGSQIISLLL